MNSTPTYRHPGRRCRHRSCEHVPITQVVCLFPWPVNFLFTWQRDYNEVSGEGGQLIGSGQPFCNNLASNES